MILWTIQPERVYQTLLQSGQYICDPGQLAMRDDAAHRAASRRCEIPCVGMAHDRQQKKPSRNRPYAVGHWQRL